MAEDDLIPELHDVGKLVDDRAIEQEIGQGLHLHDRNLCSHCFRRDLGRYGLQPPSSLTWLSILYHLRGSLWTWSIGQPDQLPKPLQDRSPDEVRKLLLVMLADNAAASVSRVLGRGEDEQQKLQSISSVQTLWRPQTTGEKGGLPVRDRKSLQDLFDFLKGNPTWETFKKQHDEALHSIPEDKDPRRAMTTLKTHLELTGKCYRVFEQAIGLSSEKGKRTGLTYGPTLPVGTLDGAQKSWRFRLARCKVTFPQRPVRAHDLGVFLKLEEVMRGLERDDHILLHTLDTLWLFLPIEDVLGLRTVLKPLLDAGFAVDVEIAEAPLCDLSSNVFDTRKDLVRQVYVYPDMPEMIVLSRKTPSICALCQVRPSLSEPETDEESGIAEFLCTVCKGLREKSRREGKFSKLGGSWEKEDLPVAWIRVALDYARLRQSLKELFRRYLKEKANLSDDEGEEVVKQLRDTALMVDFTKDYNELLSCLADRLKRDFGDEGVEEIAGERPELLAVAVRHEGDAFKIADIFMEEFGRLFPLCLENSPIFLSLSISNAKYPFFEHWRYLNASERGKAIRIQAVGRARLELSIPRFEALRSLGLEETRASSKLHRAAAVGTRARSDLLEQVELLDGIREYPTLHQATARGFSVAELLAYHKIASIGGEP